MKCQICDKETNSLHYNLHTQELACELCREKPVGSILKEAESLIYDGERARQYGPIRADYQRVVDIFYALTNIRMSPELGVTFMIAVKLSRIGMVMQGLAPQKRDNFVDLCGYAAKLNDMLEGKE